MIRSRCEEIGRDPGTLVVSNHVTARRPEMADAGRPGGPRQAMFRAYRDMGVGRLMVRLPKVDDDRALADLAADAAAASR